MARVRQDEVTRDLMAELRFGVRLVERFARLSGDFNPIHVDRLAARRLIFGERVTHGMLVTLWVLACVREVSPGTSAVSKIAGTFKAPIRVGARARVALHRDAAAWRAVVRCGGKLCASFRLETRAAGSAPTAQSEQQESREQEPPQTPTCRERPESELSRSSGSIRPLAFHPDELFAGLARFDRAQCRMLAGLSRLVGMECPGLHSTLIGFDVTFRPSSGSPREIAYRTIKFDPRFKFLSLEISGGARGRVDCLVRPAAVDQQPMAAVKALVPAGLFNGKHALVVGGSRGIGEVIAKGFAAGGGRCTLTYATGAEDAARVVADINRLEPGMASAVRWDLQDDPPDLAEWRFTHGFFLASPPIRKGGPDQLDGALYRRYRRFYVAGLETVLCRFADCAEPGSIFVYASSKYVEVAPAGFAEYATAKREGESIGLQLCDSLGLTFNVWRAPQLRTDQTTAFADQEVQDVGPIVASLLKDLVRA